MSSDTHAPAQRPWEYGARLKEARLAAGLTQIELAKAAGISSGHMVRLELNRSDPQLSVLGRLADVLGISIMDLISDDRPVIPAALVRQLAFEAERLLDRVNDLRALAEGRYSEGDPSTDGDS